MRILNAIYKNCLDGSNYIENLDITEKKENKPLLNQALKKFDQTFQTLFPKEILTYIKTHIHHKITYNTTICEKNITVNFYTSTQYSNTKLHNMIYKVVLIIYVLNLYASNRCSKKMIIDIYLTPFKRYMPENADDILEPININGGFSTAGCINTGNITIYREEEWYKVLIHELFHNFNLDFATMNIDKWTTILQNKIGVQSDYAIYETYCETWARILNVIVISFLETKQKQKQAFLSTFHELIAEEQLFSMIQCNKIYKRMKSKNNYRENTNALCYYVFVGALMFNYKRFLRWCDGGEQIKFVNTIKNVDSFLSLLLKEYNSPTFLDELKYVDTLKLGKYKKSLRMTKG